MIYCVEDDNNIRELVVYTLETTGMQAKGFEEGTSFMKALALNKPELVLLDIMLPGEDGMSILKKIKDNPETRHIPVIMVTAKGAEYDKVVGLDSGADDYVTKPFGMMELISRIKAVLRRSQNGELVPNYQKEQGYVLTVGELRMDLRRHQVFAGEAEILLTLKEYELLEMLMQNQHMVLSRDQLLNTIWGYDFGGETRTVDVHVRTLRHKLGEMGRYIETVRGVGYRMGGIDEG